MARNPMSRRRTFTKAVSVPVLIAFLGVYAWAGPKCKPLPGTYKNKISTLPKDANGITQVKVSGPGGSPLPPGAMAAFQSWNTNHNASGVNFVAAPAGTTGDVTVGSVSGSGCISTDQVAGNIQYTSAFQTNYITNNPSAATLAFEHEIGHLLGLEDNKTPSDPDIMDQAQVPAAYPCNPDAIGYSWDANPPDGPTHPPTKSDQQQAKKCQCGCDDKKK